MKNSLPYFFFCLDYLIKIGFVHYELAFDLGVEAGLWAQ